LDDFLGQAMVGFGGGLDQLYVLFEDKLVALQERKDEI